MNMENGPSPEQIQEAYIIDEMKNVSPEQLMKLLQGEPNSENAVPAEQQKELHILIDEDEKARAELAEGSYEWAEHIIRFELKRATLYHHAGHTALEKITLEDARYLAEQYGLNEEVDIIDARLAGIENI